MTLSGRIGRPEIKQVKIMEQYISVYTRQQAIEDGFLVAINSLSPKLDGLAKEHYKHPICFTSALWAR